jgi:hypothetical protein
MYADNAAIRGHHENLLAAIRDQVGRVTERSRNALEHSRHVLRGRERRRFEVTHVLRQLTGTEDERRRVHERLEEEHLLRLFAQKRKDRYETIKREREG